MIGAIVPAAGAASRFGSPKLLARVNGTPLVRHVVDRLALAGIEEIVVVAGDGAGDLEKELRGTPARMIHNASWRDGLSSSIQRGVDSLSPQCQAFVVALADQPLIDATTIHGLIETWRGSNAAAVVPVYRGIRGHPVLFDTSLRARMRDLEGDKGAREVLSELGDRLLLLDVDAPLPRDVDTPEDLAELNASG